MLDIYKLNPKTISFGYLDNQILNFYEKNDSHYPDCINLNRDQIEQFLDLCDDDCDINKLYFRGIPVKYCYVEEKKEDDRR